MLHARKDYDRIQDPALEKLELATGGTPIGAEEPVMLFRARDEFMPDVLRFYAALLRAADSVDMARTVESHAARSESWQSTNGSKRPDMDKDKARTYEDWL